jgi:hypothetical protein
MEILSEIGDSVLELSDSLSVKGPFLDPQLLLHEQLRIELPVFSIQNLVNFD